MIKTFNVNLVSLTSPEIRDELGYKLTPEQFIVYTARVSNPSNQLNTYTAPKLIKYLLDNKHFSPFEMVDVGIEIETSRGIAPQILRHWSFSFQEFSQRYAEVSECFIYPARRQDSKNRQNSVDDMSDEDKKWFEDAQKKVWETSYNLYKEALQKGIAKEQARFLLPLNTKTRMYMKGNLRDWIFYLKLRSENGTQKEHADIANAIINDILIPNFPNIAGSLGWTQKS
jgi:thymidylate synthase (FAD)